MTNQTQVKRLASETVPSWVRDACFYHIFPDRFSKSHTVAKPQGLEPWEIAPTPRGFKGGDLIGVADHLDELSDLGVNAIYLTPIFASTANHRYHTHDYFRVDPLLGGNEAFDKLIDLAHQKQMKVVIDGVFNHASRGFLQFNHALENGARSPYIDWFHFDRKRLDAGQPLDAYQAVSDAYDKPDAEISLQRFGYRAWWDLPELPKFNTANPEVREFIFSVATYWAAQGIDGWRLDVPHEIDDDSFWKEFRRRVRAVNPELYICGEIWGDASRWLAAGMFDGVMNYRLGRAILGAGLKGTLDRESIATTGLRDLEELTGARFAQILEECVTAYSWDNVLAQMNVVSSHDTVRLMTMASNRQDAALLVLSILAVLPGAPNIYYGDEVGLPGYRDPDCRRVFPWNTDWKAHPMRQTLRKLLRLRNARSELRRGTCNVMFSDDNLVVIQREYEQKTSRIVVNLGVATQDLTKELQGLLGTQELLFSTHEHQTSRELPAKSLVVFGKNYL